MAHPSVTHSYAMPIATVICIVFVVVVDDVASLCGQMPKKCCEYGSVEHSKKKYY